MRISGAKNAALPAMAAALLTSEPVHLQNIPRVRDIITMAQLLAHMNAQVEMPDVPPTDLTIEARKISDAEAPYELVRTMRASILTLGPLVGRLGHARVSLPGGCAIGARPVDLHLKALEQMGAEISTEHGYVTARAPGGGRLRGAHIVFEKITVTGTENILMAAALAEGETRPRQRGARAGSDRPGRTADQDGRANRRRGTSSLRVQGVERLHGATHTIIPDRIEAGTFLVAGAITGGDVEVTDCAPRASRVPFSPSCAKRASTSQPAGRHGCACAAPKKLIAADVTTEEYPGFATDMQAQFMALATQAEGASVITETIFENRFMHASEMVRMGADISIDGRQAIVRGPAPLQGQRVIASDLRASASLVLAGLVARGETIVDRVYHIDRGLRTHRGETERAGRAHRALGKAALGTSRQRDFDRTKKGGGDLGASPF